MPAYTFIAAWLIQSTLLGLVALALPVVCRVRQPRLLTSWYFHQAVGVVLLPLLQFLVPRRIPSPTPVTAFVDATATAAFGAAPAVSGPTPLAWLLLLWAAGGLARFGWLLVGHRRLSSLAARGEHVEGDQALHQARSLAPAPRLPQLGASTVPVIVAAQVGPCVFGGLRPTILVPLALRDRPHDERVAVYLHELTHVARSDVAATWVDEVWRALFWWQPAVWWLLARLRLAREFEVDATVVERTGQVRPYVDALLWCSTLRPALSPSTHVGSRRHAVVQRVAAMCKGGEMSRIRKWMVGSVMVAVFGGVVGAVAVLSPLRAASAPAGSQLQVEDAGPLERSAVRPTLDAPAPRRTVAVEPVWSDPGVSYRLRAHLVIDAAGRVAEARLVGPPAASRVPDGALPDLAAARDAALAAVRQWQFEGPAAAPMLLVVDVTVGNARLLEQTSMTVSDVRSAATTSTRPPLRVGGGVRPPRKVLDVAPVYPQEAKDARVQGVVIVEATVTEEGTVGDARVLRSIPLLDAAALDAVRQWRYTPTWLNGEAVPVQMVMTINFTLQ